MSIAPAVESQPSGPRMPAVRNTVAVLRALARSTTPVSAGALARSLHMPRSSTYQLLQVLVDEGLVVHVPGAAGFTLGDGVFEIGSAYSRRNSLENLAQPLLARLARTVGESATLSVLQGSEVIYLAKEQPQRPVPLVSEPGVHLPAHLTASGRTMLARLPRREVLAYYSDLEAFATLNGSGPSTLRELRQVLAEDSRRGWSMESDSVSDGITCVSAPVMDRSDRPAAAITASFPTRRGEGRHAAIVAEVTRTAAELTRRLGGRVGTPAPASAQGSR